MSDKAEKKPDAAAAPKKEPEAKPAAPAAGGGLMTKMPVLIAGAMILEAVVLFAGFKFIGGGAKNASGADLTTKNEKTEGGAGDKATEAVDKDSTVEIPVLQSKFPNKRTGHTLIYDVSIFVSVKAANQEKVKKTIADRDALIKDRVSTIIAQSDPELLGGGSEPGRETLKRQVKYQLDEIIGDGMIQEVLVPTCIGFRADY